MEKPKKQRTNPPVRTKHPAPRGYYLKGIHAGLKRIHKLQRGPNHGKHKR